MGLPAKKSTRSAKKSRASHFVLKKVTLVKCPKCKKVILPHHVCQFCGTYSGREVLKIQSKFDKKKKGKKKEKEEKDRKKDKPKKSDK